MGQVTPKTVSMGLSCGSKQSVFGWICDLPDGISTKNKIRNFFFQRENELLLGAPRSPDMLSNQNSASIWAQGSLFR
jgi:hypothetical protein